MMATRLSGRNLRASLCEIERGLFHVTYGTDMQGWDAQELPIYQVADDAADARFRIEEIARRLDFATVVWEGGPVVPPELLGVTREIVPPTLGSTTTPT